METKLDYSELYCLLVQAGVEAPTGMDPTSFPRPDVAEREELLHAGQSKLEEREDGGALSVEILARPSSVLKVTRREENLPDRDIWYFRAGARTVRLQGIEASQYKLVAVEGETDARQQIMKLLPLEPTPADLKYQVRVSFDEFFALQEMASDLDRVPALEVLEADGLDKYAAHDLYDSAVEPQWRGIITCAVYEGQEVTAGTQIRVVQGEVYAWLARPADDGDTVEMETARPGVFEDALDEIMRLMF